MIQQATRPPLPGVESVIRCKHHWVIQPAMGPESPGRCQTCGEVREFKNYVESATWGDSRLVNRSESDAAAAVSRVVAGHLDNNDEE